MYKANIKDNQFNVEFRQEQMFLNDAALPLALKALDEGGYEASIGDRKWIADIVKIDLEQKQVVLRIHNKRYTVSLQEPVDLQLEKLGISIRQAKKVNNLKAPMPGLVTKLLVTEGAFVKQGEPLLILEAMKMENVFKAATDVTISSIKVSERQAVEKGEELIAFE
jgi:biotin carboxyl carrier protein